MFYERPAVASKPQGPRGPWSGPDCSWRCSFKNVTEIRTQ